MPSLSHLNSCTATKSNLYPANFLAAAVSEPALYGLLTFQVQNLRSLLRCSVRTKMSVQVRGFVCDIFRNKTCFYGEELLAPLPTPQAGGPPLVDCPRLLIQYIRSPPPHIGGRSFRPQPWGCDMPWWQGPTFHGVLPSTLYNPMPVFSSRLICHTPLYKHCLLGFR